MWPRMTLLSLDWITAWQVNALAELLWRIQTPIPVLVADCDALLAARDTLKGNGILNWSADVAIGEWYGVTVGGSPKRVTKLELGPARLNGESRLNLAVSQS